MKLTTAILVLGMASGAAFAQNTDEIENTRNTMNALHQKQANDSNAVLNSMQAQKPASAPTAQATTAGSARVQRNIKAKPKAGAAVANKTRQPKENVSVENNAAPAEQAVNAQPKTVNLSGRRDPFISPVVQQAMVTSNCTTGKRCLAVDSIVLKGVVRADTGMIAVVVNSIDKAYFLRENDPVFNGFVVKITGDSVIFRETLHDKLGKPFTHDTTKKITTPAV